MDKQKKYSKELKDTIVRLFSEGRTATDLSKEYSVPKSTISGWVKDKKPILKIEGKAFTVNDYRELVKKNKKLEEENKILKKSIGIFKKHQ